MSRHVLMHKTIINVKISPACTASIKVVINYYCINSKSLNVHLTDNNHVQCLLNEQSSMLKFVIGGDFPFSLLLPIKIVISFLGQRVGDLITYEKCNVLLSDVVKMK